MNTREQCAHPARSRAGTPGAGQARTRPPSALQCSDLVRARNRNARRHAAHDRTHRGRRRLAGLGSRRLAAALHQLLHVRRHDAPARMHPHIRPGSHAGGARTGSLHLRERAVTVCSAALGSAPSWPDCTMCARGTDRVSLPQHAPFPHDQQSSGHVHAPLFIADANGDPHPLLTKAHAPGFQHAPAPTHALTVWRYHAHA